MHIILKTLTLIFLYLGVLTSTVQADFIRDLEFEWEDNNPPLYRQWGTLTPKVSGKINNIYGGTARLKTLIVIGADGVKRTIDAKEDFIFPDTYEYTTPYNGQGQGNPNTKALYWAETTGYYHCKAAATATTVTSLQISGALSPDVNGVYLLNGANSYKRDGLVEGTQYYFYRHTWWWSGNEYRAWFISTQSSGYPWPDTERLFFKKYLSVWDTSIPTTLSSNSSSGASGTVTVTPIVAPIVPCVRNLDYEYVNVNNPTWNAKAKAAFSSPNLNFYIGGNSGSGITFFPEANGSVSGATLENVQNTPRHLLSYDVPVKVGFGGDGYVIVTERGGNNSFYLLARDEGGNILGDIFIQRANNTHCSQDPTSAYVPAGRMQENFQEICAAVYPIQDLAPPGSSIKSIELWAASSDTGDGKVMLVHSLETPSVCYDYAVRQNGHTLASKDRNFSAVSHGDLSISLGLKSMQSDYDMTKARLRIDAPLSFKKAEYSPNQVNTYEPAHYIFGSSIPEIALGENAVTGEGGTIGSEERYFAKFSYNPPNHGNAMTFNFDLNITIDTSDEQNNPIYYLLTSDPVKYNAVNSPYQELTRCPISEIYAPAWGAFNIERIDSDNYGTSNEEANLRFPLYTQVAGKDFDFSIVSYDANASPAFSEELAISNTTVEVELIDVSSYNDAETFFRCSDPNHEIITDVGNESSIFVYFDNDKIRVDITEGNDLAVNKALKNAAFRMWMLVDNNNTMVKHNCAKTDNICFEKVYTDYLQASDTSGKCNLCSSYEGGCYQCLKHYFAKPICSRDNFSIRPASYSIQITDTNESDNPLDPTISLKKNTQGNSTATALSAGYLYKIDANATRYGSNTNALGYDTYFADDTSTDIVSSLLFQNSGTSCADTSSKNLPTRFFNGKISGNFEDNTNSSSNNLHKHTNVGNYNYHLEDLNWTRVDQDRFFTKEGIPLKTFPGVNDCDGLDPDNNPLLNDPTLYAITINKVDKNGCGISSTLNAGGKDYTDLALSFYPYSFDLTDINFTLPTLNDNFIYTNNINTTLLTDLYMSAQFRGNLLAIAKDGTPTSNFSDGCFASDVAFDINRSLSRNNLPINQSDIYAENLETAMDEKVFFQRQYLDSALHENYADTNDTNNSLAIRVLKSEFLDENNASAAVKLYYNFTKIDKSVMNPIAVSFNVKEAVLIEQTSHTHMKNDYHAYGFDVEDKTVQIFSARLVSNQAVYLVPENEDSVIVPLYVEAYCDSSIIDCDLHGLPQPGVRTPQKWRINTAHDSDRMDGLIANFNGLTYISAVPGTDIKLNQTTDRTDVNFTASPALVRPTRRKIEIVPNVPWLYHNSSNDDNLADFILEYLGGGGWAGKGNTGLVVDTNASSNNIQKRLNW